MVRINVRLSGQHKCHLCYPRLGVFRLKEQPKRDGSIIIRSCKASQSPVCPISEDFQYGKYRIESFLELYERVVLDVLMFAFNAPVLVLNTLNYFPIQKLHTQELLNHDFDGLAAWTKCRNELEQRGARLQAVKQ